MRIELLTLFPDMFTGPLSESIIKRAIDNGILDIRIHNIRDFATDRHHVTDDTPYGGGGGMVMKPEPLAATIDSIIEGCDREEIRIIYLTPQGEVFNQQKAIYLSSLKHILFICGHYEGIDERIRELYCDMEISIGDYVLTGGELPAMVIIDAVARMIPDVIGNENSIRNDSFYDGLLDFPHYTRPETFRGLSVPEILRSGHHRRIEQWRYEQALNRTRTRRPDLLSSKQNHPCAREKNSVLKEDSDG